MGEQRFAWDTFRCDLSLRSACVWKRVLVRRQDLQKQARRRMEKLRRSTYRSSPRLATIFVSCWTQDSPLGIHALQEQGVDALYEQTTLQAIHARELRRAEMQLQPFRQRSKPLSYGAGPS